MSSKLGALNQNSDVVLVEDLSTRTTSSDVSSIASEYFPKNLSSINNNEISNYVNKNIEYINIGSSSTAISSYGIAIGKESNAYTSASIAIGVSAIISNITSDNACQIGTGINSLASSFLFLNTLIVNSNGVIPVSSIEFHNIDGILSCDGEGNVASSQMCSFTIKFDSGDISTLNIPYYNIK